MNRPDRLLPFSPLRELSPSSLARPHTPEAQPVSRRHSVHTSAHPTARHTTIRTRMHPDEKRRIESLCVALSESLRATVRPSNLLRALLTVVRDAEASLQGRHGDSDYLPGSKDEWTARSARIGHARCSAVCHAAVRGFLEHLSCPLLFGGPHRPCLQQCLAPGTLRVRREQSLRAVKLQARCACVAWQSYFVLSRRRGQRDSTGL